MALVFRYMYDGGDGGDGGVFLLPPSKAVFAADVPSSTEAFTSVSCVFGFL